MVVCAKIANISLLPMLIQTTDQLRAIYKAPSERAVLKELTYIDAHLMRFISLSPFLVISSGDQHHQMDCSPRGGESGFVKVLDQQTILIPDSIGNNRLDTLTNIIATSQIGLLFFIPGIDEVVRVNGRATLQHDVDLLNHFVELKNKPKLVIKVIVEAAYIHCPKAMMRSKLWSVQTHQSIDAMPTIGQIISDQTKSEGPVESREEMLKRYTPDL
jgi:PPOX class probable FMN-dependent enzyme